MVGQVLTPHPARYRTPWKEDTMTPPLGEQIVRHELIAYTYELKRTDLLIDGDERLEVLRVDAAGEGVVVVFADGSRRPYEQPGTVVTIARDRQLMPGFEHIDPPEPSA